MAAYECGSTDFPEPPYPDEFNCPENVSGKIYTPLVFFDQKFQEDFLKFFKKFSNM